MFSVWRTLLLLSLIAFVPLVQSCGQQDAKSEQSAEGPAAPGGAEARTEEGSVVRIPADRLTALGIAVQPAKRGFLPETITVTAVIEPNVDRVSHVTSRIQARVVRVLAKLGDEVRKGETLALLDSPEHGEAEAQYLKSNARLKVALAAYERQKLIYEKKIGALKDVQAAEAEYLEAKAELDVAEQKLRLLGFAQEEIERLKQEGKSFHDTFPLLSPFAGRIVEKHVAAGEVVDPSTKLFTLADLSVVWIVLDIPERDLAKVRAGQEAVVSVSAYPNERFRGKVTYISDLLDEETRTAKVRIEITNPSRKLKPGMFAEARIASRTREALLVPKSALLYMDEGPVVFVQQDNGFLPKPVVPGQEAGGFVEVKEGLAEGEPVVAQGGYALKAELLKAKLGED